MKTLHWIIFAIAFWIVIVPIVGHDIFQIIVNKTLSPEDLMNLLSWNGFILGITLGIFALIVITLEQANAKTPGLKAMHWLQVILGLWIALAAVTLNFDYALLMESHAVSGIMVGVFALLQINFENYRE